MAASNSEPQIILYDLACTKGVCFSPVVWRIRLLLNYKQISYKTVFLEMPDIGPTLKELGVAPMTLPLAIESTTQFPPSTIWRPTDPPVQLTSELGSEIELKIRSLVAPTFYRSAMPREVNILSPRAQEYFRSSREARFGKTLEELLEGEEERWKAVDADRHAVGELMRTNKALGPFILGAQPSYSDFFIAGSLQSVKVIDEGVFQRSVQCPGYKDIYEACLPYMEKKD
ncbi:hypothetical protein TrVFT333_008696 [Trichoderma virens FT-333]|nr:hypothetical protein TrVFT333_008696 [Trichoderma virens FT-333]